MSDQYNGLPGNISRPAPSNIATSTDATPIVVRTAAPHLLTTGDTVIVAGHATNVAANGQWTATVVTATDIELDGSVGSGAGAGGATGKVIGQGVLPTYDVLDDADAADAASIDVAQESLGDRTAWLAQRLGDWKVIERVLLPPVSVAEPPAVRVTWTQNTYAAGANLIGTLTSALIPGDMVIWRLQLQLYLSAFADDFYVKVQRAAGGVALADIPTGSSRIVETGSAAGVRFASATMLGSEAIPAGFAHDYTTGYRLYLIGRSAAASPLIVNDNSTFELLTLRRTT